MSLNAEPAAPDEREAHHLPPKSYAQAAEEALDDALAIPRNANGSGSGSGSGNDSNRVNRAKDARQHQVKHMQANARIEIPANADEEQYEGAGQDSSPKSPTVRGHRRKTSARSNGSIGKKYADAVKEGLGGLDNDVYKKHEGRNGQPLTSVKSPEELEQHEQHEQHREDEKSRKGKRTTKQELKSGRQAGAGWQTSKIRWAPLNVPLQRRLQTLAVLMHTLSIAGLLSIFFFLCTIPIFWPVILPYVIYVLFSNAGTSGELSFRSERARRLPVWSLFASYFPARLHRSQALEPTRKYIFGYHPHGIISHGAFAAFATEALGFGQLFPGIVNTLLTLDSNFRLPLYREYALRMGLASVSRESCENILSKGGRNGEGMGRAITIVVGGARESLDAQPGTLRLVLRKRKGFVKLAIRTGADLVPVLAFGENEIYEQLDPAQHPWVHKWQLLVKKLMGFTVPLFHARGIFNYDVGMMPYRRPVNIVVGKPIRVIQDQHPKMDYVDEVHEQYIEELTRLWNDWKDTFAKGRAEEMSIVE